MSRIRRDRVTVVIAVCADAAESVSMGSRRRLRRRARPATPAPPPQHSTSGPCRGGVTVYPTPLPPIDAIASQSPIISATADEHDEKNPGAARTRHRSEIRGELRCGGDLLTARRRQPDRRPDVQAGKEWPARRTTGPAGMNPRREEITH